MTDLRLRQYQRAAAVGDVDAEARYLRERVRAGTLSEGKLRLAAYAGHEAARLTLGDAFGACSCYDVSCTAAITHDPLCSDGGTLDAPLPDWLTGLRTVATDLDVGDREERCGCNAFSKRLLSDGTVVLCDCASGKFHPPTPGIRRVPWDGGEWVMLRAAISAAELALASVCDFKSTKCEKSFLGHCVWMPHYQASRAIQACKDFERLRTLAARGAWDIIIREIHGINGALAWLPVHGSNHKWAIQATARVVGKPCDELGNYGHNARICGCSDQVNGETKVRTAICEDLIDWALE